MRGWEGGRYVQRARERVRVERAAGRFDWESRIEARVWRGVGEEGERRRAVVMCVSQWDSAEGSQLMIVVQVRDGHVRSNLK